MKKYLKLELRIDISSLWCTILAARTAPKIHKTLLPASLTKSVRRIEPYIPRNLFIQSLSISSIDLSEENKQFDAHGPMVVLICPIPEEPGFNDGKEAGEYERRNHN
jgi:hypothetical protein